MAQAIIIYAGGKEAMPSALYSQLSAQFGSTMLVVTPEEAKQMTEQTPITQFDSHYTLTVTPIAMQPVLKNGKPNNRYAKQQRALRGRNYRFKQR